MIRRILIFPKQLIFRTSIIIVLVVEGRFNEPSGQGALALDVGRSATGETVTGVSEHGGRVVGYLDLAHLPAAVHPGRHVDRVAPNVVLRLLRSYHTGYYRAVI